MWVKALCVPLYGSYQDGVLYEEFSPHPDLRNHISCYWKFTARSATQAGNGLHTILPDGTVSLCWLPSRKAVLIGPRMRALQVPVVAGATYSGIRFVPGAAGSILGVDVPTLRDKVQPWDNDSFAETMRGSSLDTFDQYFLGLVSKAGRKPDSIVALLAAEIVRSKGSLQIKPLLGQVDLSYRQALRRFYAATGLTPKEFARLRRLREACSEALRRAEPGWVDLSGAAGFADQAHMAREFRDIYGWPPALVHHYLRQIEHVDART